MMDIKEGQSRKWKVEHFEISEREALLNNTNCHGRSVAPGKYTRLVYPGGIMMSDTPSEIIDHRMFIENAKGRVLVTGLGLGYVVQELAKRSEVEHITVLEISEDVIKLCGGQFEYDEKVTVIKADAFIWTPEEETDQYQCCWHDIWPGICADNLQEMVELQEHYSLFVADQLYWCFEECIRQMEPDDEYWDRVSKAFFGGKLDDVLEEWDIESGNCCPECHTTEHSGDWNGTYCSACQFDADEKEEEEEEVAENTDKQQVEQQLEGLGDPAQDWMVEPSGRWYAKPVDVDGRKDWRVVISEAEAGKVEIALTDPSKEKAVALAARLNKVMGWFEAGDPWADI